MNEKLARPNNSLKKAFGVIEILAAAGAPMRLTDIAGAAGMPLSTVMRLLNTLQTMGYAQQSEKTLRYCLSRKFALLFTIPIEKSAIAALSRPILEQLSAQAGECVCLDTERDGLTVTLDTVEPEGSLLLKNCKRVGKTAPLYCTASGKFFLTSNLTSDALGKYVRHQLTQRFTPATILSVNELQMELNRIERHGYALDSEECEIGVACIAAGIRDYMGRVVAAVSVAAPVERLSSARVRRLYTPVQDTAEEISRLMGYSDSFPRGEFNYDLE